MSEAELHRICCTLDKLTLEALSLMQDQIVQKLNIEDAMTDGDLHISKSRYIMGHQNVSKLKLPTESSFDIDPVLTVSEKENVKFFGSPELELQKRDPKKDSPEKLQDPVKWFGVLVPQSLHAAKQKFQHALQWAVQCANTQTRLYQTCVNISLLRKLKEDIQNRSIENVTDNEEMKT